MFCVLFTVDRTYIHRTMFVKITPQKIRFIVHID